MPVLVLGGVDLVALLIALAAVLTLGAFWVFGRVIENVLRHLPVVGRWAGHVFTDHLASAIQAIISGADSATAAVAHWFYSVAVGAWHFVYQTVQTLADAKSWALHAYATAVGALSAAEAYTDRAVGSAIVSLDGDIAGLVTGFENDIAQVYNVMAGDLAAAEGYAAGLFSDVQSEAVRLFGTAEADIAAGVHSAEVFAQGLADSVQSEAVRLFGQAEAGIRTVEGEVAAVPGEIAGAIDGTVPGMIEKALAGAGIAAIPLLLSEVAALTTEADTCLKPLCDTVTPQAKRLGSLGHIFQGLEGLALVAFLTALTEEALHDPAAVVEDTVSVYNAVLGPVITGFRDVVGA